MTWVFLVLVGTAMGTVGYWRGSMRVILALAPLLGASILIWLLSGLLFRIDFIADAGLAWPFLIPLVIGLIGGYAIQFFARKKLPKELHLADRIAGAALCVVVSFVIVMFGSLYMALREVSANGDLAGLDIRSAQRLNSVVRWIPAVGSGSDTLMNVVEIASADEDVRHRAVEQLGLSHLLNSKALLKLTEDPNVAEDLESAGRGNILALWRLQKNPLVLEFYQSDEVQQVMRNITLADIAAAVEKAQQADAQDDGR